MIGPDHVRQLSVNAWLNSLGLSGYQDIFRAFSGIEEIIGLNESGIRTLGVRNGSHRARMVSSLVILKEKLSGGSHSGSPYVQRRELGHVQTQGDYCRSHQYASVTRRTGNLPPTPSIRSDNNLSGRAEGSEGLSEQQAVMANFQEMCNMPWYHGGIPRTKAEAIVCHSGDYLVRDSSSQPGDFVLTVRWQGVVLHFVINKQLKLDPGGQLVILYQFEEETFDSVPALVQFYKDHRKLISKSSGATILNAVPRNVSVDYYDRRPVQRGYPDTHHQHRCGGSHSANVTPTHSPSMARRRHKRSGSQPLLSLDSDEESGSYEDLRMSSRHGSMPMIGVNLSRLVATSKIVDIDVESTLQQQQRSGSEPDLTPLLKKNNRETIYPPQSSLNKSRPFTGSDGELSKQPPPKPSRTPTVKKSGTLKPRIAIRRPDLYEDDGKDYTDYDQVKSWSELQKEKAELEKQNKTRVASDWSHIAPVFPPADDGDGMDDYDIPKSNVPVANGNSQLGGDYDIPMRNTLVLPNTKPSSHFDLDKHVSGILTPENKPLEASSLATMKMLFLGSSPEVLAQHITWLDLELLELRGHADLGFGSPSGLAVFTLPHGHQLRKDLLERYECRKMLIAAMILICTKIQERAQMINQWIEVAHSLYNLVGNLYAFSAVMGALLCPQVQRLLESWEVVRENYSATHWTYETKLVNIMTSLDQASSILPLQNVSVPHIIPVVELLERDKASILELEDWEQGPDYGLDVALAHLDTARIISQQSNLYQTTSSYMLSHLQPMNDILDALSTETHIRLLWGARGAKVQAAERYNKFNQILSVLSEKAESSQGAWESSV